MIPRIFHQIWLGPNPLPDEYAGYAETWKALHPSWEHHLWTEENLPEGLRAEVYERLRVPAERSDVLRLELLRRLGGVYVDTDFECLRTLDPLLEGVDFFAAYFKTDKFTNEQRVNNAILGCTPEHPLILRALAEVRPRETWGLVDKDGTGPFFVDRLVRGQDVTVFDRRLFYPWPWERDGAVAFHHMARSWKDERGMWKSASLARSRARRARQELAALDHERARLEREIAALEGSRWAPIEQRAANVVFRNRRRAEFLLERATDVTTRAARKLVRESRPVLARTRLRFDPHRSVPVAVPRVMHHLQLGPPTGADARELHRSLWRIAHPDWEHRVWTDDDLPEGLRPEVYERLRSPQERGDLLRLELLAREGGVVVAPEACCRRRIDGLVAGLECFASTSPAGEPGTALVGSVAEHPFVRRALAETRPVEWWGYSDEATGSGALARASAHEQLDLVEVPGVVDEPARDSGGAAAAAMRSAERELSDAAELVERRRTDVESLRERRAGLLTPR